MGWPRSCRRGAGLHGLQRLGGCRRAQRERSAAARQRSPSRAACARRVLSRASSKTPGLELSARPCRACPAVVLGHNGRIAWGFTNTGADVQDLFIERLDAEDPSRYLTPDGAAPFATRDEVIAVKGAPAVTITVRETRHGPVISDLVPDAAAPLRSAVVAALRLDRARAGRAGRAGAADLNRARDWPGFIAATARRSARRCRTSSTPTLADISASSRPAGSRSESQGDGRWPVPGWSGAHDWRLDSVRAAAAGARPRRWAAVQRQQPNRGRGLSLSISADWEAPLPGAPAGCAARGRRRSSSVTFAAIQADERRCWRGSAADPARGQALSGPDGGGGDGGSLRRWDRMMRRRTAWRRCLFAAWYRELSRLIQADELGPLFASVLGGPAGVHGRRS